ncbi:MAG: hypothetical protein H6586_02145 [Flavobacteriales bacterium]|nr:hypothetical protein [Flavobacteriales bacterium]
MRSLFIILSLLFVISACKNNKEKLTEGSWNIIEATHNGQQVVFASKSIQLIMAGSNGNPTLFFGKDEEIRLPGINSHDIKSTWKIINDSLLFEIDTVYYYSIYGTPDEEMGKFFEGEITIDDSTKIQMNKNPLNNKEFIEAYNVYKEPFIIKLEGDHLTLSSSTTKITLLKDRTIDNLFKGL